MKNWFQNLDRKLKILIHLFLILAFLLMPSFFKDKANALIYSIWISLLIFEIILVVWDIQYATARFKEDDATDNKLKREPEQSTQFKIDSLFSNELRIEIEPIDEKICRDNELYGVIPVTITSDFDNFTDEIYLTTVVDIETKYQFDSEELILCSISQEFISKLSHYFAHKLESKYVFMDAELDLDSSEIIFRVPFDLIDPYLPLYTKITTHSNNTENDCLENINVDDLLILTHAPIKDFSNCITVTHKATNSLLGYIDQELADNLIERYGKGAKFYASIASKIKESESNQIHYTIQIVRLY